MTDGRALADLGEDGLIASVVASVTAGFPAPAELVRIGPGDDAAVLDVPGSVVASTDTVVEGYDFRREWSTGHDVGVKVAAQNLADIAAMGGRPLALLVSLAAPGHLAADWATGLAEGLAEECARAGAHVVGGDVSQAAEIVVTGTALGSLDVEAVRRDGARPGDLVALAGRTGPSGAGLALLLAGHGAPDGVDPDGVVAGLVSAHLAPRPPYAAGREAAVAGAHALIDTSDGLLRDAARVAVASGVVIDLDPGALVPPGDLRRAADGLGRPEAALEWVLTGGEDHALLACFPPSAVLPAAYRVIGRVLAARPAPGAGPSTGDGPSTGAGPGPGAVLFGGRPWEGSQGWTHFSAG